MLFRQLTHDDLGCASYLIGDEDAGVAAVVDPRLDIGEYLRLARYLGVRIEHVLETHNHADHVSGHGRLAAATGATIHIHRLAAPEYEHEPFDDGWELDARARCVVRALHTPGHRPEHTAFALIDTARGDAPWAVLTGDSLFVGDARPARPRGRERGGRARAVPLAHGHAACSCPTRARCGPATSAARSAAAPAWTSRSPRRSATSAPRSRCCGWPTRTAFVARDHRRPRAAAAQLPRDRRAQPRPAAASSRVDAHPLTPRQVEQARRAGALVVDVRTELQFDEAHIPGALSITARRAGFGSKLAWLAEPGQPLVLVGRDDDDALRRRRARRGGRPARRRRLPRRRDDVLARGAARRSSASSGMTVPELRERLATDAGIQLLDVRERDEWDAGHIPGLGPRALPRPPRPARRASTRPGRSPRSAPPASAPRSAASLLQRHGAKDVIHVVDGGVPRWGREGGPLETG